jgi:hypothetical protein
MEAEPPTLRVPLETGLRPAVRVDDSCFDKSLQLLKRFDRGSDGKTVVQGGESRHKDSVRVRCQSAEFDRVTDSVPKITDDITG